LLIQESRIAQNELAADKSLQSLSGSRRDVPGRLANLRARYTDLQVGLSKSSCA
jgi:hypothetical protein